MNSKKTKRFKPKYNLAMGYMTIGLIFLIVIFISKTDWNHEKTGFFLLISLFIIIPFVAAFRKTCRYKLDGDILTISYMFGIVNDKIDLQGITNVKTIEKVITYGKDIRLLMGISNSCYAAHEKAR